MIISPKRFRIVFSEQPKKSAISTPKPSENGTVAIKSEGLSADQITELINKMFGSAGDAYKQHMYLEFLKDKQQKKKTGKLSQNQFQRMKNQLWQRMEFVALGLRRAGLQVVPLNSEELIELFWSWHHPKEAEVGYYPEIPPEVLK